MNRDALIYAAVVAFVFAIVAALNQDLWYALAAAIAGVLLVFIWLLCMLGRSAGWDGDLEAPAGFSPRERCLTCDAKNPGRHTSGGLPLCDECWTQYVVGYREGP